MKNTHSAVFAGYLSNNSITIITEVARKYLILHKNGIKLAQTVGQLQIVWLL